MTRLSTTLTSFLILLLTPAAALAAGDPGARPAGGAATGEILIATAGAIALTTALLVLGIGHRTGRVALLGRLAAYAERTSSYPGWVALPAAVATASLLTAVFGMYWDIALHIGVGRDEGPLANPAHYFILFGLFGIFAAGFFAMVLPKERPSATSVRVAGDWYAPLGGVLICACGAFSLIGFPLDDVWHRLFGQDVTLWGPTHLMLIGGASMTLIGIAVLIVEGLRAQGVTSPTSSPDGERRAFRTARVIALTGGFMLGLSTFQAEFDFGVPQFRFVLQPIMIMVAAGVGLVTARMWGGPGAALGAVLFFLTIRGLLTVIIGPVLGEATPRMPLYLAEAALVELIALRVAYERSPLRFALLCGLAIGTVGLAAEWAWSHVWMPLAWPAELLFEAAFLGFAAAMAAALIGTWVGRRLAAEPAPSIPALRAGALLAAAVVAGVVLVGLHKPADRDVRATVELGEVAPPPQRTVHATVTLDPRTADDGAEWLTLTAWQGDGLVLDRLKRIAPGRYRTSEPIPVHGNWKSLIRLHHGTSLTAVPVFLPEDRAIPAQEVPAPPRFTRTFVADHQILQREQKPAPAWLTTAAYAVVALIALSLLILIAWALHRLGAAAVFTVGTRRQTRPVEPNPPAPRTVSVSASTSTMSGAATGVTSS